jgi:hypothetical protein
MPPSSSERGHEKHQKAAFNAPEYIREENQSKEESYTPNVDSNPAREVGEKVAALTGLVATERNLKTVEGWLARGADPVKDILPAVAEKLATMNIPLRQVECFGFFSNLVIRYQQTRLYPQPVSNSNVHPIRPAAKQHRGPAGRAAWRDQSLAYLASVIEDET